MSWGETRIQKPETRVQNGGRERNQPNERELADDEGRRTLKLLLMTGVWCYVWCLRLFCLRESGRSVRESLDGYLGEESELT